MPRNIALLTRVRDAIAAEDYSQYPAFDMVNFVMFSDRSACGTAACIGGYAVFIADHDAYTADEGDIGNYAKELLGLDEDESSWLFYAEWRREENPFYEHGDRASLRDVTPEQAVWSLNQIIAKGE